MLTRELLDGPPQRREAISSSSLPVGASAEGPAPHPLVRLQRTVGNQATQQLLRARFGGLSNDADPAPSLAANRRASFEEGASDHGAVAERVLRAKEPARVARRKTAEASPPDVAREGGEVGLSEPRVRTRVDKFVISRLPGDGMLPPGDCGWGDYLVLRGSVETAKAVVSMLGACAANDSCLFLATKIAAITAEIAARVALDATCFKGGDTGHRQQIQDKINMMNRCYRFFQGSKCSPELIAAMALVVDKAREVIAAGAVLVALALVAALIAAVLALVEAIAAAVAAAATAAAEAAAIAAAVASLGALLALIAGHLSPAEPSAA